MATEYGYRLNNVNTWLTGWSRSEVECWCEETGDTLIAREVSEPRIVSIRA